MATGTDAESSPTRRSNDARNPIKKGSARSVDRESGKQSKAVRKSTLLGADAVADLEAASVRRGRTQREAIELGLAMLVEADQRLDAMQKFIEWSTNEFGEPSAEDHAWAQRTVNER